MSPNAGDRAGAPKISIKVIHKGLTDDELNQRQESYLMTHITTFLRCADPDRTIEPNADGTTGKTDMELFVDLIKSLGNISIKNSDLRSEIAAWHVLLQDPMPLTEKLTASRDILLAPNSKFNKSFSLFPLASAALKRVTERFAQPLYCTSSIASAADKFR